jgi:putative flippase GtrA
MVAFTHFRRFVIVGGATTTLSYLVFSASLRLGVHYLLAALLAWGISLGFGFVLNRRYTFGVRHAQGRLRELGLYIVGAVAQLALGSAGYAILIGRLGVATTPAFVVNTALVAVASFVFTRWVTFSRYRLSNSHV